MLLHQFFPITKVYKTAFTYSLVKGLWSSGYDTTFTRLRSPVRTLCKKAGKSGRAHFFLTIQPRGLTNVKKMRTIPAIKSQRDTRNAKAFLRRRGFYVRIFRLKSRSKELGFGPSDF